jgi:hypothetical protein
VPGSGCRVEATGTGQRIRPPDPAPPRGLRLLALPANLIVGPRT